MRAVIVTFASNDDAARFARTVAKSGLTYVDPKGDSPYLEDMESVLAKIEAVVGVPTKWCDCASKLEAPTRGRKRTRIRDQGWTRGTLMGWWLCSECKKPSRPTCVHFIANMLAGANDLLPKILDPVNGKPVTPRQRWDRAGGTQAEYDRERMIPRDV
jgi:hypothetical protein